jgi:hypothetical protein
MTFLLKKMIEIDNPELKLAHDFVQYTGKNIFLTGKAGTGKTTFLHELKKISPKRMVVVAPTGVAAINAGGVTIHSFFQMPFSPYIPIDYINNSSIPDNAENELSPSHWKLNREKINIIKSLDLLVIDEISMVRADILDQVDAILRRYKNRNKIFGGVQLLMIGDIQQLAPVIKDEEWNIIKNYYDTVFFFSSKAIQKAEFISIELKHIYRQSDQIFINILNKIRENKLDEESIELLKKRYIQGFRPKPDEGYISLTTHNAQSRDINELELNKLSGRLYQFTSIVEGQFPEYSYPTDHKLGLKIGSQVMFVKNDSSREKLFFNGKIGKITKIDDEIIYVQCPNDVDEIIVERVKWQNMQYSINEETKEIEETEIGAFVQFPLKLAWAITIHKSQGLTFERAIIDANAAFAHGQVYVALSRCKSLEGLILSSPLTAKGIISNPRVDEFSREVEANPPRAEVLNESKKSYQQSLVHDLFDYTAIIRKLYSGKKLIKELPVDVSLDFGKKLDEIIDDIKNGLISVSDKFALQIKQLASQHSDLEKNDIIQERIKKASSYFKENTDKQIISIQSSLNIDIDNKAVKKSLNKFNEELNLLLNIKSQCLESCMNGFNVKNYLDIRAKASIEIIKPLKLKKMEPIIPGNLEHTDLYSKIKLWRDKKAKTLNLSHYMILPLKTMKDLVYFLPVTLSQLYSIKGMGDKKVEQFGSEIIEIIAEYVFENKLETKVNQAATRKSKVEKTEKKEKTDSKKLSFELFQSGKKIGEIANERSMAISTIEGHLAHYVGTGELKIETLMNPDKIKSIAAYFKSSDSLLLGPAKEAMGIDYSYSELRFVLNDLIFKGEIDLKKSNLIKT